MEQFDFALPFQVDAVEKGLAPPISIHACGCTCQCSGSYCTHNLASNCGDANLAPFDGMPCQAHRAEMNGVLHAHNIAAAFLSCSGTIDTTPSS